MELRLFLMGKNINFVGFSWGVNRGKSGFVPETPLYIYSCNSFRILVGDLLVSQLVNYQTLIVNLKSEFYSQYGSCSCNSLSTIGIPSRNNGRPVRLVLSMCNTVRLQSSLKDRPKRGSTCSVHTVLRMSR